VTIEPGALGGVRVLELGGIGPGPFAGMLLADFGADVVSVDRPPARSAVPGSERFEVLNRGKRSVIIDLKHREGPEIVLRLVEGTDVLIEGWRPGVAERLGLGPEACFRHNADLVYARMSGYGQDGPYAGEPGHDINYLGVAGALDAIGRAGQPPVFPVNFLGDFGGGGMVLAFGILCALRAAEAGGGGQVIDASMVEGVALLTAHIHGLRASGTWRDARGTNTFDSGSHYYEVYETADGKYVSVGALEPKFYANLLEALGIEGPPPDQLDRLSWPAMKERFRKVFRSRTREDWCRQMRGREACFGPVLSMTEVAHDQHNSAREAFIEVDGVLQPAPTPRLSRTSGVVRRAPPSAGQHTQEVLLERGFTNDEVAGLTDRRAVR
jgi:alpha-methylacyl-CoA racemase